MTQWHYEANSKRFGPVSSGELKRLAACGELSPDDIVWRDGLEPGVQASKVKGLFPTGLPSQSPRSPGVQCAVSLSKDAPRGVLAHKKWMLVGAGSLTVLFTAYALWYSAVRDNSGAGQEISSIKVRVQGGAWLTKQAGNSEPIRGLKIYFIAPQAKRTHAAEVVTLIKEHNPKVVDEMLSKVNSMRNDAKRSLAEYETMLKKYHEVTSRTSSVKNVTLELDLLDNIASLTKAVADAERMIRKLEDTKNLRETVPLEESPTLGDTVDTKVLHTLCGRLYDIPYWSKFVLGESITTTITDVHGEYNTEVPRGKYYAYARHESAYSVVEWMVPVDATSSKGVSLHFHNETAASIESKKVE